MTAQRWPTATATDAGFEGSPRNGIKGNHNLSLPNAADRWATPAARDHKGANGPEHLTNGTGRLHMDQLPNQVAHAWSTPSAHDGRRPGSDAGSTQGRNLKREGEAWQTPSVADVTGGHKHRSGERSGEMLLNGQALGLSAPTPTGAESPDTSGPRRLNPAFVCWLMGFPSGWCDFEPIEPTSFALWETRFALRRLLEHSLPSGPN